MEELSVKFASNKEVTYEDLLIMAEEIFDEKKANLEELKNTPWYKKFINSIVFQRGDTKLVTKNIKSLANLQSIFLKLYIQELKDQNTAINNIIETVITTQVAVKTIYDRCVLESVDLGNIADLKKDNDASEYLVWVLTRFQKDLAEDTKEKLQSYNMAVRAYLGVAATKKFKDISKIEHIGFHDAFYRCLLEQCVITDCYDKENEDFDFPESVLDTIEYLNVSSNKKQELMNTVKSDLESFGKDSFIKKYCITKEWIDENEIELEEEHENIKEQKDKEIEIKDKSIKTDSFIKIKELIKTTTTLENEPLGKILKEDNKIRLLSKLAFLTPKTVIAITKGDHFYLLFTTHAFYLYETGGFFSDDKIWSIPYEKISSTNIGIELHKEADKFIFEENGKRIDFSDKKINVQKLEQLLLKIKGENTFAKTDKILNFVELNIDIKVGYYHIIAAILQENKQPLYELFRVVSDNSLVYYWERITYEENDVEGFIRQWKSKVPYPYEEAIALRLIGDICTVLQFTKQNETLTANDKKYFTLILSTLEIDEQEEVVKRQIICSQVEKKFIEGKQVEKDLEELMGSDKSYNYCSLAFTSSSVLSIGLMVLGPLGVISSILSIIGVSISEYMSKRKIREANKEELREKLYKENYLSYKRALKAYEIMLNKDMALMQGLEKGITSLQKNSGFTKSILLSTHSNEIEEAIKEHLSDLELKYINSSLGEVVIASKLNYFEFQNLLAQMTFSFGSEDINNVFGLHNGKVLQSISGNYSGILFVKEGCYIKPEKNSPIKFVFYSEIWSVSIKGTIIEEVILNLFDGTSITLDGYNYKDDGSDKLFKKIAVWNNNNF